VGVGPQQGAPRAARRARRSDAEGNAVRILAAAADLLRADPDASVEEVAAAAGVSRATVHRHFGTRAALVERARQRARAAADESEADGLRPPGELAGGPTPLDVADVLNKVPPHLLGEQIVSEAQRLAGVTSVALYLIDIDGRHLLRLAGPAGFPDRLAVPLAVGPEVPREGLAALRAAVAAELPGTLAVPMLLRGRAVGVLLAVDAPEAALLELGRQAAAALTLADAYTDVFDTARRRKETTAASEVQQSLLPPRIARVSGGVLAGNVLPGYEIGGDWFDHVENAEGTWIGVADSAGHGTTAAAIGAVALGAFRARRRLGSTLEEAAAAVHATLGELAVEQACVNAILGRWSAPTSLFRWIACGHRRPIVVHADGGVTELDGTPQEPFGTGPAQRAFTVDERRIAPGERLLLVSDGVLERRTGTGGCFGLDGVRAALAGVAVPSAPSTVRALEVAIMAASADPLEDDATIVVFAPSAARQ